MPPLATAVSTWRARGELLCASTNNARALSCGDAVPCRIFSSIGTACSGIRVLQALDGEQLQLFIRLRFGPRRLAGVLAHLELERLGVADPAALREALDQILHRRERVGLLIQLVERVGLPVERGVDAGRVRRVDDARERIRGARPGAALEGFLAALVVLVDALAALGLALLLFFGALARFVFTLPRFVFARALLVDREANLRADASRIHGAPGDHRAALSAGQSPC